MRNLLRKRFDVLCRKAMDVIDSYDIDYVEIGIVGDYTLFSNLNLCMVTDYRKLGDNVKGIVKDLRSVGANIVFVKPTAFRTSRKGKVAQMRESYRRIA